LGPLDQVKPWQTKGISGVFRYLKRFFRFVKNEDGSLSKKVLQPKPYPDVERALHKLIKKVSEDTEELRFNTAIAAMMEFLNFAYKSEGLTLHQASQLTLLLAPYAPHLAEEIWEALGNKESLTDAAWPKFDRSIATESKVSLPVMINGKKRGLIEFSGNLQKDQILNQIKEQDFFKKHTVNKVIVKEIYVENRAVSFVVK